LFTAPLFAVNPQLGNGGKRGQTVQTFEITVSPRDATIRTNVHVDVKTVPKLVSTLRAEELRFSPMHLKHMLLEVRTDLKTESANWTEALHQLRMVAGHVFLKVVLRSEAHPTRFTLETNAEEMVDIEMFLRVKLFLEDDVAMSAFESVVRGF
jgi:hypothetical protein